MKKITGDGINKARMMDSSDIPPITPVPCTLYINSLLQYTEELIFKHIFTKAMCSYLEFSDHAAYIVAYSLLQVSTKHS